PGHRLAPSAFLRKDPLDFGMRAGNDVHGNELAHAPRGGGARISRRLDRTDVTANHHGDVPGADLLGADDDDVGGFHHCVGSFDRTDQSSGLDQTQGILRHRAIPPVRKNSSTRLTPIASAKQIRYDRAPTCKSTETPSL